MKNSVLKISALAFVMAATLFSGCGKKEVMEEAVNSDVTIVYTNDVHSYIDNVVLDKEGNGAERITVIK